jgi:hypothetical protein
MLNIRFKVLWLLWAVMAAMSDDKQRGTTCCVKGPCLLAAAG